MWHVLLTALVIAITLAAISYARERGARSDHARPVYSLLPGDIKYESPNGRVRVYFPIVTSLVLSVVVSLLMRFLS